MKKLAAAALLVIVSAVWWFGGRTAERSASPHGADANAVTNVDVDVAPPAAIAHEQEPSARAAAEVPAASSQSQAHPRVRLVDERTHEPVPHFELGIEKGDGPVTKLASDANGELELPAIADVELLLVENESGTDRIQIRAQAASALPRRVAVSAADLGGSLHDVRIPVGPTYRLRFATPGARYSIAELVATLKPADARMAFDSAFASVRDAAQPWIRFRAGALFLSSGPPWWLELATTDGLWYGATRVDSNEGVYRDVVAIEFAPRARLFGKVRDDAGAPITNHFVRIERPGASFANNDNRPLLGLVRPDGSFEFRSVPAGTYAVEFKVNGHHDANATVELIAGESRELDLVCERLQPEELVHIAGRVTSDSGTFRDNLYAYLSSDDDSHAPQRCDIAWRDVEGRAVGSFAFDAARAEYRVGIQGGRLIEVDPHQQHWKPDDPDLAFVVHDGAARGSVAFRATNSGDGEPLTVFTLRITARAVSGGLFEQTAASKGVALVEDVPLGREYEYRVFGDGLQSAWGEFTLTSTERVEIPVTIAAGWSAEVYVDDANDQPLRGVRVRFDDVLAGETDETGELRASLDHVPTSARFELDGWHVLEDSTYAPDTGRFRSWLPWLSVRLAKNE